MSSDRTARELVARWCDAVARGDADAWVACWDDDGVWVMPGRDPVVGTAALREVFTTARAEFELCVQEVLFGWVVDASKTRVTARWYIRELRRTWRGTGLELWGCYDDELVRGAAGWRFARRRFWLLYRAPRLLAGDVLRPPPPAGL